MAFSDWLQQNNPSFRGMAQPTPPGVNLRTAPGIPMHDGTTMMKWPGPALPNAPIYHGSGNGQSGPYAGMQIGSYPVPGQGQVPMQQPQMQYPQYPQQQFDPFAGMHPQIAHLYRMLMGMGG